MPTKVVNNGVPSIVVAESTATGQALFASTVTPQPLTSNFGQLVREALDKCDEGVVCVINPVARKVTLATGANGSAIGDAAMGSTASSCTVEPDAGQEGRSLTWTNTNPGDMEDASVNAAVAAAVAAAKPKRSVESLVNAILSQEFTGQPPIIIVDQREGLVKVCEYSAQSQADVDAVANAGDRTQIALPEPQSEEAASNLVFEGGAV
jgi:hypothetical protein